MKIYLQRNIFTSCHFQKHFDYQNNPPTFPERLCSCTCGSPQEGASVFQLFEEKKKLFSQALAGVGGDGSWTGLKTPPKVPKPSFKCSQAVSQTFLSNILPTLSTHSAYWCWKQHPMCRWVTWLWVHSKATWVCPAVPRHRFEESNQED